MISATFWQEIQNPEVTRRSAASRKSKEATQKW
jgi:hypothetical protein